MYAKNLSNEEMTKIKVVDIHELKNFGIHHFLCWNQFGSQILVRTCHFLNFQIWKVEILSNDKMTKIKVVDLDELNNFCIHHFYIWNHLGFENLVWTCQISFPSFISFLPPLRRIQQLANRSRPIPQKTLTLASREKPSLSNKYSPLAAPPPLPFSSHLGGRPPLLFTHT